MKKIFGYGSMVALAIIFILWKSISFTVSPGEKVVTFNKFAFNDKYSVRDVGFQLKAPWVSKTYYDVKELSSDETMTVLSNDGLDIKLDITVRTTPKAGSEVELHSKFGKNYLESLVKPEVRSSVRKIVGRYKPEELYSTKREELTALIQSDLEQSLDKNYVNLRTTLIRDVELPSKVKAAIEDKLQAEQEAQKYEYTLEKERKEAERKVIEAQAKADANTILAASLTPNVLKEKGIQATLKLASSNNSKVVVVGGDDGLPLILGNN